MKHIACCIHVTTRDGRPLSDARIAVEQAEGPVPEMMYVTGEDGTVQIGLPEGLVVLRIFVNGMRSRAELRISSEPHRTYTVRADAP